LTFGKGLVTPGLANKKSNHKHIVIDNAGGSRPPFYCI